MADNIDVKDAAGDTKTVATTDTAGVHTPKQIVTTVPAPLSTTGGGTEATALRVTVASDSTGLMKAALEPRTSGGNSLSSTISAASTNATSVKGSAGQVYGIYCINLNAAARYLKVYNKATAPTVGTDVPVLRFLIPPNSGVVVYQSVHGMALSAGIAFALTTGIADADTGAVSASEHLVNVEYK